MNSNPAKHPNVYQRAKQFCAIHKRNDYMTVLGEMMREDNRESVELQTALGNAVDRANGRLHARVDARKQSAERQAARAKEIKAARFSISDAQAFQEAGREIAALANATDSANGAGGNKNLLRTVFLEHTTAARLKLGSFEDDGEFDAAIASAGDSLVPGVNPDHSAVFNGLVDYHKSKGLSPAAAKAKVVQRHPMLADAAGVALDNVAQPIPDGTPIDNTTPAPLTYAASRTLPTKMMSMEDAKALGLSTNADAVENLVAYNANGQNLDPIIARANKRSIFLTLAGLEMGRKYISMDQAQQNIVARHPALTPDDWNIRNSANQ